MSVDPRAMLGALLPLAVVAGLIARGPFTYGGKPMPEIAVTGRSAPEGCLRCHADTRGLGPAHEPSAVGCSPCHLGDPVALDAEAAHKGMVVLGGGLAVAARTCGQAGCHPDELRRVNTSLMAGVPGILAVDRYVFGERPTPKTMPDDDLRSLDAAAEPRTPAESHVRKLCASCHLGLDKTQPGDQGFFARGGGCTACHLGSPVETGPSTGRVHPDVTARIAEARCEGCHSRSGRISLSYHGKLEVEQADPRRTDVLPDGRPFTMVEPDVHARAGMTCIDCHTERDVMGDGAVHGHGHEAVDVACEDCHAPPRNVAVPPDRARVAEALRASWSRAGRTGLSTAVRTTRGGTPLWRTDALKGTMLLQHRGEERAIPPWKPAAYHTLRGHERLACQACHAAWAPRCARCHTELRGGVQVDHLSGKPTPGEWVETAGANGGGPPLLALGPRSKIAPFVEGMTLSIDGIGRRVEGVFWAPLDPHTTSKARVCESCHTSDARATYPSQGNTTREEARLLDEAERSRILRVGDCLPCHGGYDDPIYLDFRASLGQFESGRARACRGAGR